MFENLKQKQQGVMLSLANRLIRADHNILEEKFTNKQNFLMEE